MSVPRLHIRLFTVGALLGLAGVACEGELESNFGPPGGLSGRTLPTEPTDSGGGTGSDTGKGGSDTGKTKTDGGGKCVEPTDAMPDDDGPVVDDGCKVSWSQQIYPNMTAGGKWGCGNSACHGGGANPPNLTGSTAQEYYNVLAAYSDTLGATPMPFILPCSTDPDKSAFICVVSGTNCGLQMPEVAGGVTTTPLSTSDIDMIKTWIGCGAQDD